MPSQHHIPALTRTFASIPRCTSHPYSLLTVAGECPRCAYVERAAIAQTVDDAREARRLQALTRATGGRTRQRMTEAEALRIGSAA